MIYDIFATVLKMSVVASLSAALVIPLKYILKKCGCPGNVLMLLWLIIAFRFLSPYAPESEISLFNLMQEENHVEISLDDITVSKRTANPGHPDSLRTESGNAYRERNIARTYAKSDNRPKSLPAYIWLLGISALLASSLRSYLKLRYSLRFAIKREENIYISEIISTSFVFGILRPKIYIPANASGQDMKNMIAHEQTHIKRLDHITKILAWTVLVIHWFNPLAWGLFKLFSDDTEYACDEATIKKLGIENKKSYLNSLLASAIYSSKIKLPCLVCSFANHVKARVKNVLGLKKHSGASLVLTLSFCAAISLLMCTNGISSETVLKIPDIGDGDFSANNKITAETKTDKAAYSHNAIIHEADTASYLASGTGQFEESDDVGRSKSSDAITLSDQTLPETVPLTTAFSNNEYVYTAKPKAEMPDNFMPAQDTAEPSPEDDIYLKSDEVCEDLYMGYEHLELLEMDIDRLETELNQRGLNKAGDNANLSQSYIRSAYSCDNESDNTLSGIKCDANGNISLYADMNTETHLLINIYDSETGESVGGYGILANGKNAYSFIGFDKDKTYDISIDDSTGGEWNIEGNYIIY